MTSSTERCRLFTDAMLNLVSYGKEIGGGGSDVGREAGV